MCDLVLTGSSPGYGGSWLEAASWLVLLLQEQLHLKQKDTDRQTDRQTYHHHPPPPPTIGSFQCSAGYGKGISPLCRVKDVQGTRSKKLNLIAIASGRQMQAEK